MGEFNNVCYKTCPENTKFVTNKCECVDKFYKRFIDSTHSLIECLKEGDVCPPNKPYLNGQECSNNACNTNIQREIIINGVINYECTSSCNSDEYKYSSNPVKCISKCPEAAPYQVLLSNKDAPNYRSCMTQANCDTNLYFIDETTIFVMISVLA